MTAYLYRIRALSHGRVVAVFSTESEEQMQQLVMAWEPDLRTEVEKVEVVDG